MSEDQANTIQTPKWFQTVSFVALAWNLMGVFAFISHVMLTPEDIAQMPLAEQALYTDIPSWATNAFGLAVFAGALGSLGLVLKKIWSKNMLIVSLVAVLVHDYHSLIMLDTIGVYGKTILVMPTLVIIISLALIWLSTKAKQNSWLTE